MEYEDWQTPRNSDAERSVKTVLYSPDGKFLAAVSSDGAARVWFIGLIKLEAFYSGVFGDNQFSFSPDGKTLAFAETNSQVVLAPLATLGNPGTVSLTCPAARRIRSLTFASGDRLLANCDGVVYGLNLGTPAEPEQWRPYQGGPGVVFSQDGSYFASQAADGRIVIYKPDPQQSTYLAWSGLALADAACAKLKPLAGQDPDYAKACPAP